ncbi:hypothetical protein LAZ67_8001920 [Cordylochernes scorpioides]|uniref:Uncharacterized protein n=1 Tax=Cordylochernes scorpioides TaxID=51811 RepID=A0ABY6KRC4_9ARAC|nr:hypothetical protein LAZ67_8001920 [Cordylochernes scorpioides]
MDWTTRGDEEDGGGSMERPCGPPSVEEALKEGDIERPCGSPSVEEGIEGGRYGETISIQSYQDIELVDGVCWG